MIQDQVLLKVVVRELMIIVFGLEAKGKILYFLMVHIKQKMKVLQKVQVQL